MSVFSAQFLIHHGWCPYRDISFLCDAMVTRKKTTLLPPVSEKQVVGGAQVSRLFLCVCIYLFAAVHVSVCTHARREVMIAAALSFRTRASPTVLSQKNFT